jgi:hypothetical protein
MHLEWEISCKVLWFMLVLIGVCWIGVDKTLNAIGKRVGETV